MLGHKVNACLQPRMLARVSWELEAERHGPVLARPQPACGLLAEALGHICPRRWWLLGEPGRERAGTQRRPCPTIPPAPSAQPVRPQLPG